MRTALRLNTAATTEPVSLAEAKRYCRIDGADEDIDISRRISAAREYCELTQGRTYVSTVWDFVLDDFPNCNVIELPRTPIASVTSITYRDSDEVTQTVSTDVYRVLLGDAFSPGRIVLKDGQVWPTADDEGEAVTVTFTSGTVIGSVPETVRQQILLLVSFWNERPELMGSAPKGFEMANDALHWANAVPRLA